MLWQKILSAAKEQLEREPDLAEYLDSIIFSKKGLLGSISSILSHKLHLKNFSSQKLEDILVEVFQSNPTILEDIEEDLLFFQRNDPACHSCLTPLMFYKGFHGLACYRAANELWKSNRFGLALFFQSRSSEVFGIDIHPAAEIAGGIMIDHATGVVIGETCSIQKNVYIFQGVTLGGKGNQEGKRHPDILEGASIYASSTILGDITIGENAVVAAGSLVLKNVSANETVAGIPARKVKDLIKNQSEWDPGDSSL